MTAAGVIAALFVQPKGSYFGLEGVDMWDEKRDARKYDGPHPVVAHPPCSRWCQLAGLVEARYGHRKGDDGGCFAAALASVRKWGGVLEHPAYSSAWPAHGLNAPPSSGGWVWADFMGGWTCHVQQLAYGHAARKSTWLYAHSTELPSLAWGSPAKKATAVVSWCRQAPGDDRTRISKASAIGTPPEFRDMLLAMAASARNRSVLAALEADPSDPNVVFDRG